MADDDIEIKIGTSADVSGADQAQDALDQLKVTAETLAQIRITELSADVESLGVKLQNANVEQQRLVAELQNAKSTGTADAAQDIAAALALAIDETESLNANLQSTKTVLDAQKTVLAQIVSERQREVAAEENLKAVIAENLASRNSLLSELDAESAVREESRRVAKQAHAEEVAANAAAVESINGVKDAFLNYIDALKSGDQEAAIQSVNDLRDAFEKVEDSTAEIPDDLENVYKKLDKIEKQVSTKRGFKKLSNQADGAAKSLSKIEKLQVAEAIGNVAREARGAGKDIANLSVENDGLLDTSLNATTAVGDLVGSMAAGFAASGPIGAGIALVTAGLSFMSEEAKKYDEIFKGDAELGFKRSKESIDEATDALKVYAAQQDLIRKNQDLELSKIQDAIDLELVRARNKAELGNLDREIEKIKILGNNKLSDKEKDAALEQLDIERINAEAEAKISEVDARVEASESEVKKLLRDLDDAYFRIEKLQNSSTSNNLDEKIDFNARQKDNISKNFFDEFSDLGRKESAATTGGRLSDDEFENQIDRAVAAFDEAGDKSVAARKSLADDLLEIVNEIPDSVLDEDGRNFKDSLQRLSQGGKVILDLEERLNDLASKKEVAEEQAARALADKEAVESAANDAIRERDKLRGLAPVEREQINQIAEKKVTILQDNNDLKDQQEAAKKAEAAAKKAAQKKKAAAKQAASDEKKRQSDLAKAAKDALRLAKNKELDLSASGSGAGQRGDDPLIGELEKAIARSLDGTSDAESSKLRDLVVRLLKVSERTTGKLSAETITVRQLGRKITKLEAQVNRQL